ncbi:chromate efflux transporter [Spongiibacter taiwanensis]|uniref:chromate efflux transporter n=1 Tax=Spongiibacter taiwanensis TaxID=1748242 RepID=UPI0020355712|nr:chromate efflux transporter [Spongiibacter taiwanensis]USA44110.1 chromate efflux transporter [Spongiibacter taiwanensis]
MLLDIFRQFLYLGCVSFGGPAAHIGYFRRVFVDQKAWLSSEEFAAKLALCQFLPGPSSSQLGFAIGCHRGQLAGGVAAFLGFTLPSFLLMLLLAVAGQRFGLLNGGMVSGLKLLAAVVVADAVLTMSKQFCVSWMAWAISLVAAGALLLSNQPLLQLVVLMLGGLVMAARPTDGGAVAARLTMGPEVLSFGLTFVTLLGLSLIFPWHLFSQFYVAGSMVFGGGHVVLPLLQNLLSGLDHDTFLTGYSAAQAVPGPMFSLASFLGAQMWQSAPVLGALVACAGLFLPGFLLLLTIQPSWTQLSARPRAKAFIGGVNAGAVGLLMAAWINLVQLEIQWNVLSALCVVFGFVLLRRAVLPVWILVLGFAALGALALPS